MTQVQSNLDLFMDHINGVKCVDLSNDMELQIVTTEGNREGTEQPIKIRNLRTQKKHIRCMHDMIENI